MEEDNIRVDLASADVRGEIINVYANGKKAIIVHTEPGHHRGGYVFPNTTKKAKVLDGSVIFHLVKPENPKEEKVINLSVGDGIRIPNGTAYRESTRNGTWFVGFSSGDEKCKIYEPYRKIVERSFEK